MKPQNNLFFSFLIGFILFNSVNTVAQNKFDPIENLPVRDERTLQWGYWIGLNNFDYDIKYKTPIEEIVVKRNPSFSIGLVGQIRLSKNFSIRTEPGFSYTPRELYFTQIPNQDDSTRIVKSSYVQIPLLIRYNGSRWRNIRPYLTTGLSGWYNMGSKQDNLSDNYDGDFRVKKQSVFFEVGFGMEFYLQYFKFIPSIRGLFGLSNVLVPDNNSNSPWTKNIETIKSRAIMFVITFE